VNVKENLVIDKMSKIAPNTEVNVITDIDLLQEIGIENID
jgi:aspartate carbamoyltransferase regulatory subunit